MGKKNQSFVTTRQEPGSAHSRIFWTAGLALLTALGCVAFLPGTASAELNVSDGMPAGGVLGQPDLYTPLRPIGAATAQQVFPWNNAAPTASNASLPGGMDYDGATHTLLVADYGYDRVVGYDVSQGLERAQPLFVLGQPDFTTSGPNTQIPSHGCTTAVNACGLQTPYDTAFVTVGSTRYIAVADGNNHRVVLYDVTNGVVNGQAAAHVLGQPDLTSTYDVYDCQGVQSVLDSQCGLHRPFFVKYVASQQTFITGGDDDRVSFFDFSAGVQDGMLAAKELGQPDFTSVGQPNHCAGSNFSIDACSMYAPSDVTWDPVEGLLYIAVTWSERVMVFNFGPGANLIDSIVNGGPADWIIGQPDIHTAERRSGGPYFDTPGSVTLDRAGNRLFIADVQQCRILMYDITGGAQAATQYGAVPTNVIGWPSLDAGGWVDFPYFVCGRVKFNDDSSITNYSQWSTPTDMSLLGDIMWDATGQRLLVADALNSRVLDFSTAVGGVAVGTVGGSSTSSPNPDGSTVVTVVSSGGSTFQVTFPAGTGAATGGNAIDITVSGGGGGQHPSIIVDATLPAGAAKSVSMPFSNGDLCINDVPHATISTQGSCSGVKVKKADLPASGSCVNWKTGGTVCKTANGSSLVINGLANTALYYVLDSDGDGVDDGDDLCPGTDLAGPIPSQTLRPNHVGDATVLAGGCNCSQVLVQMGNNGEGPRKFGCTPGIVHQWEQWVSP